MMNDPRNDDTLVAEQSQAPDTTMAMVVYALFLASFVVGFTGIVGLVIAYIYRGKGPQWLDEHYRYQIRTFWIGLVYGVIAGLLTLVLIGFPLLLLLAVWMIIRCVKGFKGLQEKRAPSNVDTWLI
ncbi:membrane protein [Bisbaumannia pacifica]|uniref:Membrane protein n=2 Tax=Bisbaumannia pacifica TaxID=77098 RepID=A0A510XAV8_9GAMM|nr:membrane protein [Halomonas pacifica]GKW50281.1 membrane protein [Halomonas sp. NCCP-2165]